MIQKIVRDKSPGKFSSTPFFSMLLNAIIWVQYGLLVHNTVVLIVNAVGIVLNMAYIVFFVAYSSDKTGELRKALGTLLVIGLLSGYVSILLLPEAQAQHLGSIGSAASVWMCAAPLTSISTIVRTKDAGCLSFVVALMTALASLMWLLYGALVWDVFLIATNVLSMCLGMVQLLLIGLYPSRPRTGKGV